MKQHFVRSVCALALLLGGCQPGVSSSPSLGPSSPAVSLEVERHAAGASTPAGIVVPLYAYPGPVWNQLIAQKKLHPRVPILAIADVTNDGVGNQKIGDYVTGITLLQKAGVTVIGYVATFYGKRSLHDIEIEMKRWYGYYRVTGIFLDEMDASDPKLYTAATAYAHAHALPFVMGNPGDDAPGNAGPDVINFYEQSGYPSLSFLRESAHRKYGRARWSYMAGAVPYNAVTITASLPYVHYLYVTDGKEPECYCELPSYFAKLVALLDSAQ